MSKRYLWVSVQFKYWVACNGVLARSLQKQKILRAFCQLFGKNMKLLFLLASSFYGGMTAVVYDVLLVEVCENFHKVFPLCPSLVGYIC